MQISLFSCKSFLGAENAYINVVLSKINLRKLLKK